MPWRDNWDVSGDKLVDVDMELPESEDEQDMAWSVEDPGPCRDLFPDAARVFKQGETFMDRFDADEHAGHRNENVFYPFALRRDWELASWISRSSLSMTSIDLFLSLELVSSPFD